MNLKEMLTLFLYLAFCALETFEFFLDEYHVRYFGKHSSELLAILLCVLLIVGGVPCEVSVAQQPQGAPRPSPSSTGQR